MSASIVTVIVATGCSFLWHGIPGKKNRTGVSSSLVNYLYPRGEIPQALDQTIPNLKLPLRIGLAFVPSEAKTVEGLSEAHRSELLDKAVQTFSGRDFIKEILIIPDTYLRSSRGFEGVDQIARLYALDVLALVSYDQVAHVDVTKGSILYWTIVGAYFVKGSRNDVQTFVDTAVFDVKTHKLLFRAPGVDKIRSTTTLVNSSEKMRKARESSFDSAMANMTQTLDKELDRFTKRIKEDNSVLISHREGYTGGGGAFSPASILILTFLCIGYRCQGLGKKVRPLYDALSPISFSGRKIGVTHRSFAGIGSWW